MCVLHPPHCPRKVRFELQHNCGAEKGGTSSENHLQEEDAQRKARGGGKAAAGDVGDAAGAVRHQPGRDRA